MTPDNPRPPYLRDSNTKRIWIWTDQLAKLSHMEPYYPKNDAMDPCKVGAAKAAAEAAAGVPKPSDDNPLVKLHQRDADAPSVPSHLIAERSSTTVVTTEEGGITVTAAVADTQDELPFLAKPKKAKRSQDNEQQAAA